MILGLSGHLGDRVSALVDGQLSPPEEERAWAHAMTCPGCRRLIEREGWLKTRLSTLADPAAPAPSGLLGSLYDVDAWAAVDECAHAVAEVATEPQDHRGPRGGVSEASGFVGWSS